MNDEIFDRTYQQGRAEMNAGIDRAFARAGRAMRDTLSTLHRIQWSAPWHGQGAARTNRSPSA